jgi:hypothetical protein
MTKPGQPGNTVNVYIDGYNFYYSISKHKETLPLGWCNFSKLADLLAARAFGNRYVVNAVKYYTSTVGPKTEMRKGEIIRRKLWLEALEHGTNGKVLVVEGYHKPDEQKGRVEKRTDTNIAIGMVRDALLPPAVAGAKITEEGRDKRVPCDAVILMSGDDDFWPAIEMIGREYGKAVAVFHPHNDERPPWAYNSANNWVKVDKVKIQDLEQSRLEDVIDQPSGPPITWAEYLRLKQL